MMYHRKHRLVAQLLTARNGAQAASVGKETKEEKREVRRPHPSGNEVCILYQRHCISLLSCIHNVLQQHILYILIELEEIRCISRHDLPQNLHNFQVTRVRPCLKIAGRMSSEDPRRPLNRGETEKRMRGGVLERVSAR